ncbi:hypothetical protein NIES4075_05960 [Tolypothrix sp. NIES-4075]|nr:hypothetical protein NIES4075_05960 [Tolypothrix sp. NIES-4075]
MLGLGIGKFVIFISPLSPYPFPLFDQYVPQIYSPETVSQL